MRLGYKNAPKPLENRIGIRSAWQELGVLELDDLITLIGKEMKAVTT